RYKMATRSPGTCMNQFGNNGRNTVVGPGLINIDFSVFKNSYIETNLGSLNIFHEDSPDKLTEVETLKTEFGAGTIGVDPKTHNLFLTTADFGPAPAAPTKENPEAERKPIPGTFRVLVYGR
ncbi:MAG TPA: hypothetical protein VNO32_41435, partial [Candidatus Acidoferrum sp.]|nr:hypothetical protein [Candidatus Acidoferrum sp.]